MGVVLVALSPFHTFTITHDAYDSLCFELVLDPMDLSPAAPYWAHP